MFLVVEIVERLVAGTSVAEIWHRPEFALGIVLQVVVAVAAYALLRAVDRLARGLAKSRSIVVAPRRVTNIVVSLDVFQTSRVGRPGAARAPPLSAAR
jgi:hypothetical protein